MELKSSFAVRLALFVGLWSITNAQSTTTSSTNATSTTSSAFTHTVSVGYAGFTFTPMAVLANVGDIIEFDFYPTNHSVVRAEYGYPCVPYEDIGVDKTGFFSGFEPVDEILSDPPKYSVRVNDTNPIFYYCSAPGSCINYGMVGAINPNATETVARQQQLAKEATFMLQPGEAWPSESSPEPSGTSGEEGSATSSASASTSTAASGGGGGGLSGGAIAGIVVGIVAALVILGALFFLFGRNRALSQMIHRPGRHGTDPESDGRGSALAGSYNARPKHVSGMTMMQRPEGQTQYANTPGSGHTSPYLPQYAHMYPGPEPSPSLTNTSDVMSPRSPRMMPGSPAPEQQFHGTAPAYSVLPPELPPEEPKQGPHELAASDDPYPSRDPPKINPGADHYA